MLLLILTTISYVNAIHINDTEALITDNLKTDAKISNTDYRNFSSLSDEINSSLQTRSLNLTTDYSFDSNNDKDYVEGITINLDNFIIDGQGHTIDAKKQSRIFNIKSKNVILKNIIFINGNSSEDGGAIYWAGTNATIINSTVKNSKSVENGGAIFFRNTALVEDCEFINNEATFGGAIKFDYKSTVINSTFKNNFAKLLGGGICSYQEPHVFSSIFINNTASDGGGIQCNIYGLVENTLFIENRAIGYGGAITSENNIQIKNSTFTNNTGNYAGAICFKGEGYVENSFFNENSANLGGAIMASGYDLEITASEFYLNTAKTGLSIYCDGKNVKIENTTFSNINSSQTSEIYLEVQKHVLNNLSYNNITKNSNIKEETKKDAQNTPKKHDSKKKIQIMAKSKIFKSKVKSKKYYVKLKSGKKIVKNKKVFLKIKGRTYIARTNKYGKALFKIKLMKKGKFKTIVKFNGDTAYKSSKKIIFIKIK